MIAAGFSLDHLGRAPARFDASQLDHWQRETIARSTPADLWGWISPLVGERVPTRMRPAFVEAFRANVLLPADALVSGKALFLSLRAALSRIDGPGLADLIALMPRERVRERFAALSKKP